MSDLALHSIRSFHKLAMNMPDPSDNRFWNYLKDKEIDYFPAGKLRWWLLALIVLGWAVEQYEALKNAREGVIEADVQSAFELTDAQLAELVAALEKRTGRKVKAQVRLDKSLIGGVRVVMGDKVIDGSARAQLGVLESALKA